VLASLSDADAATREAVMRSWRVLGAIATVAIAVCTGAVARAAAQTAVKLPAPLVGAWEHTVTKANWVQLGIATEPTERLSMLVSPDGTVIAAEKTDVRFTPLSGHRIVISNAFGCGKKKGMYHWSVAAGQLTLTKLQDTCAYSIGLYSGVWKREKI
jgi:hypothetical protein